LDSLRGAQARRAYLQKGVIRRNLEADGFDVARQLKELGAVTLDLRSLLPRFGPRIAVCDQLRRHDSQRGRQTSSAYRARNGAGTLPPRALALELGYPGILRAPALGDLLEQTICRHARGHIERRRLEDFTQRVLGRWWFHRRRLVGVARAPSPMPTSALVWIAHQNTRVTAAHVEAVARVAVVTPKDPAEALTAVATAIPVPDPCVELASACSSTTRPEHAHPDTCELALSTSCAAIVTIRLLAALAVPPAAVIAVPAVALLAP
jgi:hypothetical protein